MLALTMPAFLPCQGMTAVGSDMPQAAHTDVGNGHDSLTLHTDTMSQKKSLMDRLPKFVRKIVDYINDVDTNYSVQVPYDACIESHTSIDQEVLVVNSADGLHMKLASEVAFKTGPYIGYGPVNLGYLFTLNPTGRRKNVDFTIRVNTNVVNLDFVYRCTGGNFNFRDISYPNDNGTLKRIVDKAVGVNLCNDLYNTVMGINVNWIPNHRKFSNKAATSYGCRQIKSAGSPIFGLGYTYQKLETDMSLLTSIVGLSFIVNNGGSTLYHSNPDFKQQVDALKECKNIHEALPGIKNIVKNFKNDIILDKNEVLKKMLLNSIPTTTRVYDWHLQVGYAYNWVMSHHFMVGAQLIVCPGIKRFTADNKESIAVRIIEEYDFVKKYLDKYEIDPNMDIDQTSLGLDVFGRVSVRWHNKHWYAGLTGVFNGYYYDKKSLTMNYRYWTGIINAGYNFYLGSLFKKKKKN